MKGFREKRDFFDGQPTKEIDKKHKNLVCFNNGNQIIKDFFLNIRDKKFLTYLSNIDGSSSLFFKIYGKIVAEFCSLNKEKGDITKLPYKWKVRSFDLESG